MKVSFENGVLTAVTDISKATIDKGIAPLNVVDDKGREQYRVNIAKDGVGKVDKFSMTCNQYVDGKAAMIIVTAPGTDLAAVQKQYGDALVEAGKYTAQIASAAAAKEETIAAMFGGQK